MRIQNKLFLVLTGSGICLVVVVLLFMRWSIDRGMLEYVNTRETQRLQPLVNGLEALYAQSGSWDTVESNPRQVRELFWQLGRDSRARSDSTHIREQFGDKPQPRRHPPRLVRLVVLNAGKTPVFGSLDPGQLYNLHPIKQSDAIVGWLASPKRKEITEGFELAFINQQHRAFITISALVLALAFIVGWPLARHFLKPIRAITDGISQLNRGNYQPMQLQRKDEFGQLARDINELATTLAHNDTIRKRWLADTSHELRTPISILKGELEAMLDGVRPTNQAAIESLHQEALQLQKLVEDLHELSNADIGGLRYYKESTELVALLEEQLQRHRPGFEKAGLQLEFNSHAKSLEAWIDASRFHQLIDNLLNNSLKYTASPGKVLVKLQHKGDNAELTISDSAPGVSDAALEKLFEHLYRVDNSRNRLTGGSGLGLAICRRIIEGHHGTITASHSELGGITIAISFPLNQ